MVDQPTGTNPSLRPGNLPIPSTPLIGRANEVAAALDLLRRADVRLLTLIGLGGIGKTRLALQVAAELHDDFADGVRFVNLASISDPGLVAATIAQVLDVRERADQPLIESLKEYLRRKQLLLVLDNFEQVVEAAPLVGELLAAAPGLKALVTSREPLHLYGEHEYEVPPLGLPPHPPTPAPTPGRGGEDLAQYAAVQLFVARAQAVKVDFALTHENASAVAAICQRLDGLPLAIELAAARIKLLAPQVLLARLDQRFKLLTGGARDLPERHQTIRAAIDWSYHLLSPAEQCLFRRLAVFVGGWTVEAADRVCNADHDLPIDVFDGLTALLDKSLLKQVEGVEDEPRFTMLETIREYALERLEQSGEAEEMRRRHAAYFLALAEAAEPELTRARQKAWWDQLGAEQDNLRAALSWSLSTTGDAEVGLRLLATIGGLFWINRGQFNEARGWFERALERTRGIGAPLAALRARALSALGAIEVAGLQGDPARAMALLEEGLTLFQEANDRAGMAGTLVHLGRAARNQGDYGRAQRFEEEGLAIALEQEHARTIGMALMSLGDVALDQGDTAQATARFQKALTVFRGEGEQLWGGWALINIGRITYAQGDLARALACFTEALALFREFSARDGVAQTLLELGRVARAQGDAEQAAERFAESLGVLRETGNRRDSAFCLEGLAGVAAARRQPAQAARLFGAAEALRESAGIPLPPVNRADYERDVVAVGSQLNEAIFATAWAEGRALPLEQAIEEALRVPMEAPAQMETPGQAPQPASASDDRLNALTPRERQVLALLAQGYTNRAIADALVIAERTAEIHVSNILGKLGVTSRTQAAAFALAHGLATPADA